MTLPKWNDPTRKFGTMIRTALWLLEEVGVGNSFTKERHRQAFAGIAQADRRLRDLRSFGWVIYTNLEDASLNANEQRFVAPGLPVWEPGSRRNVDRNALSAKERMAVLSRYDYQCTICGIAGGEAYPDEPDVRAVLSLSRRTQKDGQIGAICECKRCRGLGRPLDVDLQVVIDGIQALGSQERTLFGKWIAEGRRSPLDLLWAQFRRLSASDQAVVRARLEPSTRT